MEFSSAEEYYQRSIVLPSLNQLVQQMNDQFGKIQAVAANIIHLVPSVISIHVNKSSKELTSFSQMAFKVFHLHPLRWCGSGRQSDRLKMLGNGLPP